MSGNNTTTKTTTLSSTTVETTVLTGGGASVTGSGTGTGGGTTGGGTTGGGTTPVVTGSTNAYPLAMPTGIAAGAPVTLGKGPNSIQLTLSNNPGTAGSCEFVLIMNQGTEQTALAGPLTVTSDVGETMTGSQVFTINGDFTGMTGFEINATGPGLNGLWINAATVGLIPWWCNQDAANSRGTGSASYATSIFNSNGSNMTFLPQSAVPAAPIPVPAPALTTVAGTIAGVAKSGTLATLLTDLATGQTLTLGAGTFVGTGAINVAGIVTGAGTGVTTINATDLPPYENKAVLVPTVAGVTIEKLTIQGAAVPASLGNNAAGVRDGAAGIGFTLTDVEITGCQDGILTFASNITVNGSNIHGNGAGDGYTHEMYVGGSPTTKFVLGTSTVSTGPLSTHAVKSRAGTTTITGGVLTGGAADGGAVSGSVVDIPDGGLVSITGTTIALRANAANTLFFGYSMESALNQATGATVTMTDVIFDGGGVAGEIQAGSYMPTSKLVLVGCTHKGTVAPTISGFATVTGAIAAAA